MSWFDESHLTDEQTEAWRSLNDLLRATKVTKAEARPKLKSLLTYHQVVLHFIYNILHSLQCSPCKIHYNNLILQRDLSISL